MNPSSSSLPSIGLDGQKRTVNYVYDRNIGNYYYGLNHHMKPLRIHMTHELLEKYGLLDLMEIIEPTVAIKSDMVRFHDEDFIDFLETVTPDEAEKRKKEVEEYNVHDGDCPVIYDLFDYCKSYVGASITAARLLNDHKCDIAINWSGGLHHARRRQASGFCYVNDIVLAILKLLEIHHRVLYVDIDVHHGDGVEEAFYTTDRVMTVSFHKYGNFFPGTGDINDTGYSHGKYYALNVPLNDGIDDQSYQYLFESIMPKVMVAYCPNVVVLQCGADSLAGDRLGVFNLSIKGHAQCVRYMRSFNVPLLLLGGGGYTMANVARCWSYETAVALGVELENEIPQNQYMGYFYPEYRIHTPTYSIENKNTFRHLEKIKARVLDNLSKLPPVPSVQFQKRPPKLENSISSYPDAENLDNLECCY